jgi:hypothetical protein
MKRQHLALVIKTLILVLALVLTAQAQKTNYDKLTGTTEVTSERLTVYSFHGFLVPPTKVYLRSFVLHKKDETISGLRVSVFNTTGWFPRPSDLLYILADGQRYQYEVPLDVPKRKKHLDTVTTEIDYPIDANTLKAILSSKSVEMRVDNWSFTLKEKQLEKLRKPSVASFDGKPANAPSERTRKNA